MGKYLEKTQEIDPELLSVPEIKQAIKLAEEARYTPGEIEAYESYWKQVSSEKTLRSASRREGMAEGMAEGKAIGAKENAIAIAQKMKSDGIPLKTISKYTGLKLNEIKKL